MRRLMAVALLSCLTTSLVQLEPASSGAVTRVSPMRAEHTTASVSRTRTFHLEQGASSVAAYWKGSPGARVTLAFSSDGKRFAAPVPAERDEAGRTRGNGTTYGALQDASGAVAVRVTTDRPLRRLTVLGLTDRRTTVRSRTNQAGSPADAATTEPAVVPRASWGADPQYMTWDPAFYPTKKLVVHHTDTSNEYTDQAGAESQVRAIYYYHSVTQDWGDIGYNFLIDKFGNVYEGRYSRDYAGANPSGDDAAGNGVTGAHTQGWNSGTVGIAMLGTFTDQDVTPAARRSLEAMLAWEASRNGIDPQATQTFTNPVSGATVTTPNIAGHRDYAATACPGDAFYATLPTIRSDVAALVSGQSPPPDTKAPTAPTGLVATGGAKRVALSWEAATDNVKVTGYQVWRSRSASSGFVRVASPAGTSYTNTSLSARTTYYYKVRAKDAAGNLGPFSTVRSARTS
jgi:hypothetical protein